MPSGAIHFVTETGQTENGIPSKKRLSKINSHVARFSHNRRKFNKNNNSAIVGRTPSPLQVDFVLESPQTDDFRWPTDSPKSVTSYPPQLLDQTPKTTNSFHVELPERRRSTGSAGSKGRKTNKLTSYHNDATDLRSIKNEDESAPGELVRRFSDGEPQSFGQVPRMGSLGSILQLGSSVGLYEKYLLNYYFTELQTQMFGFHRDAAYCPQRIPAARTIQKSPAALHWILIIAEEQLNRYAPEPSKSVILSRSILKRRANGYGILRSLLNNPDFDLETAVMTLRYAISAECYVRNGDACKEHLKAFDALLQQPGNREFFASHIERTALSLSTLKRMYVCAPVGIKLPSDFEAIKTMVFLNLRRLQSFSNQNHAELIRHACTTYLTQSGWDAIDQPGAGGYHSKVASQESLLGRYIATKKSTLFSTYAAEAMNATCDPQWRYTYQAGLFALFYDLNMTLASFGRQNLADKIMFLQRLKSALDNSSATSLLATSVLSIVDWVREQYFSECFGKEETILKEVDLCTYETNSLKIFTLLDSEFRIQLTAALRAWLLSDISADTNMEEGDLKEEVFLSMEDQVTRAFWKENLASKPSPSPSLSLSPEP